MTFTGDFTSTRTLDVAPEAIVEGSTFADRYAIEGRLGTGAQSTVYSALDMLASPPKRVAIKIARFDETNLSREIELLARIHRDAEVSGVVRLVEPSMTEFGGVKYLVLEHIDGPTLRNLTLPFADVCRLGSRIARTLSEIHDFDIVVADVKPENILLRDGIAPILVDFGAAREIHDSHLPGLFTPAYAAPEQRAGHPPTPASDVYALALVLEELAGPRPPKRFVSAITRCTATDPAERPSAREFSQLLEAARVSQSRKQFPVYVMGFVGLLVLLSALLVVVMKPNTAQTNTSPKPELSLISSPRRVLYLAASETHVYWSDGDGRTVYRAPLGGGPEEWVTQLDKPAHKMAVSGQTLFIRSPGQIWAFAAGKLERFAETSGSGWIAADDRHVVWTDEQKGDVVLANPQKGAPLRILASGQARPYSVTMDGAHVYWANEENGSLARVVRAGGEVEVLVRGQSWPAGAAVDATHLYWIDRHAGQVMRIRKNGGEPQILASASVGSFTLALSGTHLYWTSREDFRVLRVLKTGGVAETVARGQLYPHDIVARGNSIFFTNNHPEGGVMRLELP